MQENVHSMTEACPEGQCKTQKNPSSLDVLLKFSKKSKEFLIAQAESKFSGRRVEVVGAIVMSKDPSLKKTVKKLLSDENAKVRRETAWYIINSKNKNLFSLLRGAIFQKDSILREQIAWSIGELGQADSDLLAVLYSLEQSGDKKIMQRGREASAKIKKAAKLRVKLKSQNFNKHSKLKVSKKSEKIHFVSKVRGAKNIDFSDFISLKGVRVFVKKPYGGQVEISRIDPIGDRFLVEFKDQSAPPFVGGRKIVDIDELKTELLGSKKPIFSEKK